MKVRHNPKSHITLSIMVSIHAPVKVRLKMDSWKIVPSAESFFMILNLICSIAKNAVGELIMRKHHVQNADMNLMMQILIFKSVINVDGMVVNKHS